jgi:FO synthase
MQVEEVVARASEASERGATEVCLQGGIHPRYTGQTYLDICSAIHAAEPNLHIHAFSPLEIWQGAKTLNISVAVFLRRLKAAGLSSLPGTAAEVLDDGVRAVLCPDKIDTQTWINVMRSAHEEGLRSTATIMFGHVDEYEHWARHLLQLRTLQRQTGGFTEFVALPFVASQAPMYLKGQSRPGPTARESVLMHAVARLVLDRDFRNIQTSWVKMGPEGARCCLRAGANDLGGTLMNESITRAAGGSHGQEMRPAELLDIAKFVDRPALQRTTLYDFVFNQKVLVQCIPLTTK